MDGDQLDSDSDDVLLRVCGAQLYTMICVHKEQLKKEDRSPISRVLKRNLTSLHRYQWVTPKRSHSQCH